jgi:hypothetical protein
MLGFIQTDACKILDGYICRISDSCIMCARYLIASELHRLPDSY